MADICNYEIHVRGTKKACILMFHAMPKADDFDEIIFQNGTDEEYVVHFVGACNWDMDAYCEENEWDGSEIVIPDDENSLILLGETLWYYSLSEKSKMLRCEIDAFSIDESGFQRHAHYKNGECIVDEGIETKESIDGLTFVITGKLNCFENREEITEYIEEYGGNVTNSISKNTNYLINNDSLSTSSKNKKAQELGIPVITEKEFIEKFCDPDEFDETRPEFPFEW